MSCFAEAITSTDWSDCTLNTSCGYSGYSSRVVGCVGTVGREADYGDCTIGHFGGAAPYWPVQSLKVRVLSMCCPPALALMCACNPVALITGLRREHLPSPVQFHLAVPWIQQ